MSDGDGDDWASWCRDENYRVEQLATAHRVTLRARADVLFVGDLATMDSFDNDFRAAGDGAWIDWEAVASAHDGVVIAPYQWSRRSTLDWYWGWDCASGCIWNLDAIDEFAVVAP